MSKREFTPEEIAKSLEVCFGTCCGCGGCIYEVEPDLSSPEVDCRTDLVNISADLIEAQAKRIGELEAELLKLREENRWIPVGERLPDEEYTAALAKGFDDVEVIAMIEGAKESTALRYDGTVGVFFAVDDGDELILYRVARWRPMPKGPEVGHE